MNLSVPFIDIGKTIGPEGDGRVPPALLGGAAQRRGPMQYLIVTSVDLRSKSARRSNKILRRLSPNRPELDRDQHLPRQIVQTPLGIRRRGGEDGRVDVRGRHLDLAPRRQRAIPRQRVSPAWPCGNGSEVDSAEGADACAIAASRDSR